MIIFILQSKFMIININKISKISARILILKVKNFKWKRLLFKSIHLVCWDLYTDRIWAWPAQFRLESVSHQSARHWWRSTGRSFWLEWVDRWAVPTSKVNSRPFFPLHTPWSVRSESDVIGCIQLLCLVWAL